ncbi:FAD-dependent oxidoreductase [Novosphingobium panipatense]|jgi:2,4-dienoyl-CoA reductase-like NADH-dependent reductase (Old Yellow Enzyme family)/NADPH-dependent 2,4-dienoyl-CoA reductase/sulfur reductase-like enzyme|uniref:NAD(P)/FAD-dependent oxidoreductase n=1 Tax=Novosphingobium TaxID=165696 RepID=UPI000CDB94D0|nr:NAD(P)/FAD-dependent oxidoreductase [Novosphingobium sp. HII-3]
MTSSSFDKLLSPGRIGPIEIPNRIFVTAMGVSLSEPDGYCNERLIAYHEEQAKGGAGLIITGVTGVAWPVGAVLPNQTAISDDKFVPGLTELVQRIHRHGARIAAQLHHGGLVAGYSSDDFDAQLWAPSLPDPFSGDLLDYFLPEELAGFASGKMPSIKVMEQEDIDLVVRQFGEAARRARQAGFDALEIHGAHGYLLSSFVSPKTNKRTDRYGGSLENRLRLLLEVIAAVKAEAGPEMAIWCKLDSREIGKPGGIAIPDFVAAARMIEAAGVDAIAVSAYHDAGQGKLHSASNIPHEPESNLPAVDALRREVALPIIASGRIEPDAADKHIGAGRYDFLAMGRKLLADPALPRKLADAKVEQVRPCIYCYTCVTAAYVRQPLRCAVNSDTGFECERTAPTGGRHYAVIGGGPGGMEAACRLAEAGNRVTLLEKGKRLGGTLRFASLAYPPNEKLLKWLMERTRRLGIEVRLDTEATPEMLRGMGVERVIVATGARRDMPDLPGNDLPHVLSGDDLRTLILGESSEEVKRKTGLITRAAAKIGAATGMTANLDFVRRATHGWMPLGQDIVIVGGELVGLELAEFLHERGRTVTVVEPGSHLGKGLLLVRRMRLVSELKEHGVAMHTSVQNIAVGAKSVTGEKDGKILEIAADHVIVAMGASGDTRLADHLRAQGFKVETVGDCNGVGYIEGAIRGAADAVARLAV